MEEYQEQLQRFCSKLADGVNVGSVGGKENGVGLTEFSMWLGAKGAWMLLGSMLEKSIKRRDLDVDLITLCQRFENDQEAIKGILSQVFGLTAELLDAGLSLDSWQILQQMSEELATR